MRSHVLALVSGAFVVVGPYVVDLTLATPTPAIDQPSLDQLLIHNTTHNATLNMPMQIPSYEEYDIPATDLKLHFTLLRDLDADAMQACLRTATIWVGFQRQADLMPNHGFEWKDPAGAVFYIRSLSRRLSWADVNSVLRGLKESLQDQGRSLATSFTVAEISTELFVGQGRLSKYKHPESTALSVADSATS
ncbi:hypothetical protein MMC21_007897 [Puttea exsequens]|nr:hypothetical protein [Puttea exsequens]